MSELTEARGEAWLCKFDGSIHRRGIRHEGDERLVPESEVAAAVADALARGWDEGFQHARFQHDGALVGTLADNPHRVGNHADEARHGAWLKDQQRYEDGCKEDRPCPSLAAEGGES